MYAHHLASHQPMRAPDLMAYLYIIATCHGEYHFHPCMAYDVAFRMKASRFILTSWGHIDPSLPTQTLAIPPPYPPPYLRPRPPPPTLAPLPQPDTSLHTPTHQSTSPYWPHSWLLTQPGLGSRTCSRGMPRASASVTGAARPHAPPTTYAQPWLALRSFRTTSVLNAALDTRQVPSPPLPFLTSW